MIDLRLYTSGNNQTCEIEIYENTYLIPTTWTTGLRREMKIPQESQPPPLPPTSASGPNHSESKFKISSESNNLFCKQLRSMSDVTS